MTDRIKKIVCLGDSITSTQDGPTYATFWQQMAPSITIIPKGVNGEIAAEGLKRLKDDVLENNPDLVTIMYGHNEVHQQIAPSLYRESLIKIVDVLKVANVTHIWLLTPNQLGNQAFNPYYQPYLEELRVISKNENVTLIDLWRIFSTEDLDKIFTYTFDYEGQSGQDYIHPNEKGHKIIANILKKEFDKLVNSDKVQ